jgi:hypothetical protein
VPAIRCLVEHLDDHLAITFIEEGEQATGLKVVGAGELVPPGVKVHFTLPVEQDRDRPPAEAASGLLRLQLGRLSAFDELDELFQLLLDVEGV